MTHTSTEQPWWRTHTDEIERKVACGEMNAATCFTKMLWLVSEASQAQRVPLNKTHEYAEHKKYPGACRHCGYAEHEPLQHGITQEKQG